MRTSTPRNLVSNYGIVAQDFETLTGLTGTNGTLSLSDDCVTGSHSTQLMAITNPNTGFIDWYPSPALDLSEGNNVSFYFKPSINTVALTFWVYLYDAASATKSKGLYVNQGAYTTDWQRITIGKNDFTGGALKWNNITHIRLGVGPASGAIDVKFDLMRVGAKQLPRCVLFFDDNFTGFINIAYPYLSARGIKGNLAFVRQFLNTASGGVGGANCMTRENFQTLYDAGWDIVNHSENHLEWAELNEAERITEVNNNRNYMVRQGWTRTIDSFCYSLGEYGQEYESLIRKLGYICGRDYTNMVNQSEDWDNPSTATSAYRIRASAMQSKSTFKNHVDTIQKYGGTMFAVAHDIVTGTPTGSQMSASDFYEEIEYLRSRGIQIITLSEYLRQLNNPRTLTTR